jgi:hypothetical protein
MTDSTKLKELKATLEKEGEQRVLNEVFNEKTKSNDKPKKNEAMYNMVKSQQRLNHLSNCDPKTTEDVLLNIIKEGAEKFGKETGRKMTYSEMREMYG